MESDSVQIRVRPIIYHDWMTELGSRFFRIKKLLKWENTTTFSTPSRSIFLNRDYIVFCWSTLPIGAFSLSSFANSSPACSGLEPLSRWILLHVVRKQPVCRGLLPVMVEKRVLVIELLPYSGVVRCNILVHSCCHDTVALDSPKRVVGLARSYLIGWSYHALQSFLVSKYVNCQNELLICLLQDTVLRTTLKFLV